MLIGIHGKIGSGKDTIYKIINYLIRKDLTPDIASFESCLQHNSNFLNSSFENKKFADKLKDIVCLLINCTREQLEDQEFKSHQLTEEWWYYNYGNGKVKIPYLTAHNKDSKEVEKHLVKLTPRILLQTIGTECGREIIHPNIWVNSLFTNYLPTQDKNNWFRINTPSKDRQDYINTFGREKYKKLNIQYFEDTLPDWIITDVRFPNEVEVIRDKGGILIKINRPFTEYDNYSLFVDSGNASYNDLNSNQEKMSYNLYMRQSKEFKDRFKVKESKHLSEIALDDYKDWDFIIENNGNLESLVEKVKQICIKLKLIKDENA